MKGLRTWDKSSTAGNSRRAPHEFIVLALTASASAHRGKVADILANCSLPEDFSALSEKCNGLLCNRPALLRERDHAPRK